MPNALDSYSIAENKLNANIYSTDTIPLAAEDERKERTND
jgi:hypothetical protein